VTAGTKRQSMAHMTGVVYLAYFAASILGLVLVSHELPGGLTVNCLSDVLYVVTAFMLYRLLRVASQVTALVALACCLIGCTMDLLRQIHHGWERIDPLLFFGPYCILLGVLLLRADFLPQWIGWPLIAAGVGWLAYLMPAVALHGKVVIFPLGFVAEFELMLWLLAKGVAEGRWAEAEVRRNSATGPAHT